MDPALTRRMEQVDLDEGTVLVEQGDSQPWLWFIVDGRVRATLMSEDGPVTVGQVSAPVWLGEIGFIDGGPATATLTCAGPVRLLRPVTPTLGPERLSPAATMTSPCLPLRAQVGWRPPVLRRVWLHVPGLSRRSRLLLAVHGSVPV